MQTPFDRCNLFELATAARRAHGGEGTIAFCRIAEQEQLGGSVHFLDYAEVPAGATIGLHRHDQDEEEYYLVLSGAGRMERDGVAFPVRAGDLVRTRGGSTHRLENAGTDPVRLFVFEVDARR